jgi:hypothetical protein
MPYVSVAAQVGFGMRRIRAHPVQFRSAVESDGRGAAHRAHPPLFARAAPSGTFPLIVRSTFGQESPGAPPGAGAGPPACRYPAARAPTQTRQPRACIRARVTAATSGGAPGDIREQAGVVGPQAQERCSHRPAPGRAPPRGRPGPPPRPGDAPPTGPGNRCRSAARGRPAPGAAGRRGPGARPGRHRPGRWSTTPGGSGTSAQSGALKSGLAQSSTVPQPAARACARVWSSRRRASPAAPAAPRAGMSRVLTQTADRRLGEDQDARGDGDAGTHGVPFRRPSSSKKPHEHQTFHPLLQV